MVITRRANDTVNNAYDNGSNGSVGLLERPEICEEKAIQADSNVSQTERMQQNLQKLLNYDRFNEENMQQVVVDEPVKDFSDEDIRPTSTTMQFGDDNIDQIREEMRQKQVEEEGAYHLNAKGKIAVVLYSLVVAVILALIVLNTNVLATVSAERKSISAELNAHVTQYNAIQTEIDNISNPDYIIDVAENQYGMVKGN